MSSTQTWQNFPWSDAMRGGWRALAKAPYVFFLQLIGRMLASFCRVAPLILWVVWAYFFYLTLAQSPPATANAEDPLLQWVQHPWTWIALLGLWLTGELISFLLQTMLDSASFGVFGQGTQSQQKSKMASFWRAIRQYFPAYLVLILWQMVMWGALLAWFVVGSWGALSYTATWARDYGTSGSLAGLSLGLLVCGSTLLCALLLFLWNGLARSALFFKRESPVLSAYSQALDLLAERFGPSFRLGMALLAGWGGLVLVGLFINRLGAQPELALLSWPLQLVLSMLGLGYWLYSQATLIAFYAGSAGLAERAALLEKPQPTETEAYTPGRKGSTAPVEKPASDPNVFLLHAMFPELFDTHSHVETAPPAPAVLEAAQPEASAQTRIDAFVKPPNPAPPKAAGPHKAADAYFMKASGDFDSSPRVIAPQIPMASRIADTEAPAALPQAQPISSSSTTGNEPQATPSRLSTETSTTDPRHKKDGASDEPQKT